MLRICAALSIVAWCLSWASADDQKVPLETELPEEVLAGTPPDVLALLFPGLEKLPEGDAPEFLVPAGTQNLALNKPVTSSDSNPVLGELKFVTDGKKEGTEENYVELGPMQQWVQIDLGQPSEIYAIYIWHYFREARSYHDVVIQVAADADFTENVRTIYSNDQDNSLKKGVGKSRPWIETYRGKLIDAAGVPGRFVRLYSAGNTANDLNHYVEVEVYGKPAK
jgi:hypothetical protein